MDRAVIAQVLEAIQPAGLHAALDATAAALHDDATRRQALEPWRKPGMRRDARSVTEPYVE